MTMRQLYTPKKGAMRVAAFMSGTGSNLRKIIELQNEMKNAPFEVALIFSDTKDAARCNAAKIAKEHGIEYACSDIKEFYAKKGAERKDLEARKEYDHETAQLLKKHRIDVVALCGYMSILTGEVCDKFLTVNIHPADLRILDANGRRKYAGCMGSACIRKAAEDGMKEARSTTHIVTSEVDGGQVIMVSKPVSIEGKDEHEALEELKQKGDWAIYPETIRGIAEGRFYIDDEEGMVLDLAEEKELIRSAMRKLRDKMSDADVKKKSAAITERLVKQQEYIKAATIMFYFGVNKEVHTENAIKHAMGSNKTVVVPVTDAGEMRIIPAKLENMHQTKPGAFGIPEPAVVKKVNEEEIELVIVPGVAFDGEGNRVGYGLGYYDKFLHNSKAAKIALAYEMQITDRIRATRNDVPVDKIITEERAIEVVR